MLFVTKALQQIEIFLTQFFIAISQHARRKSTKKAYLATRKAQRKRVRSEAFPDASHPVAPETSILCREVSTNLTNGKKLVGDVVSGSANEAVVTENVDNVLSTEDEKLPASTAPLRFTAVQEENGELILDLLAYHRGREGMEMRDEKTGDLLEDLEPTDTNHCSEEPKTFLATVQIEFPIDETCTYRDTISWDLLEPTNPSPTLFATNIAKEYGLSYTQCMDLAESIQSQLRTFVHDNYGYSTPILLHPAHPAGTKPPPTVPVLYGEVTGFSQIGGSTYPLTQKPKTVLQKLPSFSSATNRPGRTTSNVSGKSSKLPAKRRSSGDVHKAEEVYVQEARIRLYEASLSDIRSKHALRNSADVGYEVSISAKSTCHICRQKQNLTANFPCGDSNHCYCMNHLCERLGLFYTENAPLPKIEYCPICALTCNCKDCNAKLGQAALAFRKRCLEQDQIPENTVFDNILKYCKNLDVSTKKNLFQKGQKVNLARSNSFDHRPVVPKISRLDFPREVANGVDVDIGFENDYQTIFNEKGCFLVTEADGTDHDTFFDERATNDSALPALLGLAEDGSVDFCNVCNKVGNLICCDFCPRAYHGECIPCESRPPQESVEMVKWECPRCHQEKTEVCEDKIDGQKSAKLINNAFEVTVDDVSSTESSKGMKLLSILHEMVCRLMDYDFGYMFRNPVNCKEIPMYTTIVKRPMDLGTISSNLLDGSYRKSLGDNFTLENVALAVLKDIELVWHNCFLFNVEGSAVYRMAEVLRRKEKKFRQESFEPLLSDYIKRELAAYVAGCESERESQRQKTTLTSFTRQSPLSAGPRHKIAAARGSVPKGRPVAVLDPDTGKIVKIYSTIHSAANAIDCIVNMKRPCEWDLKEINTHNKLRAIFARCQKEANVRLFGYRWLYLDDLRNQKVSFTSSRPCEPVAEVEEPLSERIDKPEKTGPVQMVDGGLSFFFNSVDESLSYPGVSYNLEQLRSKLLSLVPGAEFSEIAGRLWRRLVPGKGHQRNSLHVAPSIQQPPQCPEDNDSSSGDIQRLTNVSIVKEDMVAGTKILVGFGTKEAAYKDWLDTLDASVVPYDGAKTMDVFLSFFLHGDRNIDGIRWRIVRLEAKEQSGISLKHTVTSDETAKMPVSPTIRGLDGAQNNRRSPVQLFHRRTVKNGFHGIPGANVLEEPVNPAQPFERVSPVVIVYSKPESLSDSEGSKVFDVECIRSPKTSLGRSRINGSMQNKLLEKFQLGENGETVDGDAGVRSSSTKEATFVR
jgi:hypothetical protein